MLLIALLLAAAPKVERVDVDLGGVGAHQGGTPSGG